MRDDGDSNWFARWDEGLPSLDELMPISQSLITPDLALAFDIRSPSPQTPSSSPPPRFPFASSQPNSGDLDSTEGGSLADEPARTLKRPRLVWTPQLHKRFVDAVAHLGIKNAVPKTIMQLMSVDGLTRENVASHLQKYRLYLKRMQQGPGACDGSMADSATDRLFATSPVPSHFLRGSSDHYLPFVHPRQQIGYFEHSFLTRQQHHRMGVPMPLHASSSSLLPGSYNVEDLESASSTPAKKVLTLFPSGE